MVPLEYLLKCSKKKYRKIMNKVILLHSVSSSSLPEKNREYVKEIQKMVNNNCINTY